ncbi:MAG: penicillin-insensitive murein endopeptidase [Bacteriovoracaceae bacterium]|nr:penicillin-insensitive murein endopeptidase [Bacteriovoracaceae bacterium]
MKIIFLITLTYIFHTFTYASEAVGFYSSGSLDNSVSIDNYQNPKLLIKLFRSRGQLYGTHELGQALDGLSAHMSLLYPTIEPVQVGDMSSVNGGKIPRHKSHQNGLDADVVYYRINELAQSPTDSEWAEYFVNSGKLNSNFHSLRNWEAFKYLVENHSVSRILVDGAVKKDMCRIAKERGESATYQEVLRRLRIENTVHKTHYHVRLKCPSGSPKCRAQVEPPQGSGC